jgi:hypothetical protein
VGGSQPEIRDSGFFASVSGGGLNNASGPDASISGGDLHGKTNINNKKQLWRCSD